MIELTSAPELIVYRADTPVVVEQYRESHEEDALDEALAATFPSSDPIAISIT